MRKGQADSNKASNKAKLIVNTNGVKKTIKITLAIMTVLLVVLASLLSIFSKTKSKNALATDPEIARSLSYEQVKDSDADVSGTNGNVRFDAYFLRDLDGDGYAEKIRGSSRELSKTDNLYMELNVQKAGRLENGKISINGQNFELKTAIVSDDVVSGNYISDNTKTINLKTVNNGTQKLMQGTIRAPYFGNDTNKYSKVNTVTLTGNYIDDSGNSTAITKTVNLTVDWHGYINAAWKDRSYTQNIENIFSDDHRTVTLSFYISNIETYNYYDYNSNNRGLILSKTYLEANLPELGGNKPTKVETSSKNYTFNYDENTSKVIFEKEATLNSDGIVTDGVSDYNNFALTLTYPVTNYDELMKNGILLNVPFTAYYEGYNNPAEEFGGTPAKSNVIQTTASFLWEKPSPGVIYKEDFSTTVGTYRHYPYDNYYISKREPLKIYNNYVDNLNEDTYPVRWRVFTGESAVVDGIQMKETNNATPDNGLTGKADHFQKDDGKYVSMEKYISTTGIYFDNASSVLNSENGWIKVYDDDTDKLLYTFTSKDWSSFSSSNPYVFETPQKHIRVETSAANKNTTLYVNMIKKIDDNQLTKDYTKEQFDSLEKIWTFLEGSMKKDGSKDYTKIETTSAYANYEAPKTSAYISASNSTIGTQEVAKNVQFTISTDTSANFENWTNGNFIVELPENLLDINITNLRISNPNVKILAYEIAEKDGKKLIKISTENTNPESFSIYITADITANPNAPTATETVKLYASNEENQNYYSSADDIYDVNGNSSVKDKVAYSTTSLYLVSPSSLLTTEGASNYNNKGETVIAPQIATVDKNEAGSATVTVNVTNNYSSTVSETKILGKIPFKGNTYSDGTTQLGSQFSTTMKNTGIQVPDALKGKVKVYYSTKENPTNDLTNADNAWQETHQDFSQVKTYLIDFQDYVLQTKERETFTYDINVPNTANYNDTTYSNHKITFCLDTPEGKLKTYTETTKLGIRIERKYNIQINKVKQNSEIAVKGAMFSVTADGEETSRIATTNDKGIATIEKLYVDKTYTLKEIRTPASYEKNEVEAKFKVVVNPNNNNLEVQWISGQNNIKANSVTQANDTSLGVLNIKLENTPKYQVVITKTGENDTPLAKVKYRLSGGALGDSGILVMTGEDGTLSLTGLSRDVSYTLQEVSAKGYYVEQKPFVFKLVKNNGKLEFNVLSGKMNNVSSVVEGTGVEGLEAQDKVTAKLTDEEIPTYSISLTKYEKGKDTKLKGAQYKLMGEGLDEKLGEVATTDENGTLTFTGLYEYVEGKYITGEYTLKEITPPEGYTLDSTELKFKAQRVDGKLQLTILSGDGILNKKDSNTNTGYVITNADNDKANIAFDVNDKPLFKLTKTGDLDKALPGTKFVLYELDNDRLIVDYAKDINGNYVGNMEKIEGSGGVTFKLAETSYPWTNNSGIYKSGNKAIQSSTSSMTSEEFTLVKDGSVSFKWACTSESTSYDYLYYTIINTKDNSTVSGTGTNTKIGGGTETNEDKVPFTEVTKDLPAGSYKIKFTYTKDGSGDKGIDEGLVKDISVNGANTLTPVVTTDENGEISTGIKSGLYKAVEISAPEGYDLPAKEADRTFYFGIDMKKDQETREGGVKFASTVAGENWNKVNSVKKTSDGGFVTSGYFSKAADFDGDGNSDITGPDNEYSGFIAKYAENGDFEWAKPISAGKGEVRINKAIQLSDGGYALIGYYNGSDITYSMDRTTLTDSNNKKNAIIIKTDNAGNYAWSKQVDNSATESLNNYEVKDIAESADGKIVFAVNEVVSSNAISSKLIQVDLNGSNFAEGTLHGSNVRILGIFNLNGKLTVINSATDGADAMYIKTGVYVDSSGTVSFENTTNGQDSFPTQINDVTQLADGHFVTVGNYTGTVDSQASTGYYDGIIQEFDATGTLQKSYFMQGSSDDILTSVTATEDGGFLVGGYTYSSSLKATATADQTISSSLSGYSDGYIIKYGVQGNGNTRAIEWFKNVSGTGMDEVNGVTELSAGQYAAVGYFNSPTLSGDQDTKAADATVSQYTDGFVLGYGTVVTAPEIPAVSELNLKNNLKTYKITTDVEEVEGVKGGSISGEDQNPYETVKYGYDSTKEIKMTPENENYKIVKITINGVEQSFTPQADGSVTLPQFKDMQENKHIVVTFSAKATSVLVHHYIDGTTTQVANDDHIPGIIGKTYTTTPHTDLEEYELKKDSSGNYVIPDNASGTFTKEEQVVTYYYVKRQGKVVTHHYIEGTSTPVTLQDGSNAKDEEQTGEVGSDYQTQSLTDKTQQKLNPKYELSMTPDNAKGKFVNGKIEVTYYYKAKQVKVTTKVKTHEETLANGQKGQVKGGTISGEGLNPYETVIYGENSTKDIVATPDEGYRVKSITINGTEQKFTANADGTVSLAKFNNMTEDKEVVVEFEKIPAKVIVHHYIENTDGTKTTNKVPLQAGGVAEDETKAGVVGDKYATKEANGVSEKYEVTEVPQNSSGTMTKDTIVVTYYYKLKPAKVIVHHYIDGTTEKVPSKENGKVVEDEVKQGYVDDNYTSEASANKAVNYEVVQTKLPNNAQGKMTVTPIEVIYYYKIIDPEITTQSITKKVEETSDNKAVKITHLNQLVTYNMVYTVTLDKYKGDSVVKIVDHLPYEIDESVSGTYLADGVYDKATKTVTWKVPVNNINTFATGKKKVITITETLTIAYKDIDTSATKVDNRATGQIELKTPEKTSDEVHDDETVLAEFKQNVTVRKVWAGDSDNAKKLAKRPSQVTFKLTGSDSATNVHTIVLSSANAKVTDEQAGTKDNNVWEYTFENLDKYDANGKLITYKLDEEALPAENAKFYSITEKTDPSDTNNNVGSITNTFKVPDGEGSKVTIPVTKIWNDQNNANGKRPDKVTIKLTGKGEGVNITKSQEISVANVDKANANNWLYTFTGDDLVKYDNNGDLVTYTIDENDLNSDFYVKGNIVNPSEANNYAGSITNNFSVSTEKRNIRVTKIWDDNSNKAGKRPTSITLKLTGNDGNVYSKNASADNVEAEANAQGGAGAQDANSWGYNFSVPKYNAQTGAEVEYTLTEEITGDNAKFYTVTSTVNPTADNNYRGSITNKYQVPDTKKQIKVTKVWDDNNNHAGKRPTSVVLKVTGNGQEYKQEITKDNAKVLDAQAGTKDNNTWEYTFEVPLYDANGNEIVYTPSEELNNIYYTAANAKVEGNVITNKFVVPGDKINIKVSKVWDDNSNVANKRPDAVSININGNDGSKATKLALTEADAEANNGNVWTKTVNNLPKYNSQNGDEITYTLSEDSLNSAFYPDSEVTYINPTKANNYTGSVTNKFVVTNEDVTINVNKVWTGDADTAKNNKRPASVNITLTGKGQGVDITVTKAVTGNKTDSTWQASFADDGKGNKLPKLDNYGNAVKYTIFEEDTGSKFYVLDSSKTINPSAENNYTASLTNKFNVPNETVSITATKVWDDNNNANGKRPSSVTLQVIGNGKTTEFEATVSNKVGNDENKWSHTFANLPKYDGNGDEIVYTVNEKDLGNKFYTKTINQDAKTITNKFQVPGETVEIPVTKVWDDSNDANGKRPENITAQVKAKGEIKATEILNANNNWSHKFVMPKYDGQGNEIAYTIDEADLTAEANKYYTKEKIDQDKHEITNKIKEANLAVHHYIENVDGTKTTNKVPMQAGGVAEDENTKGTAGQKYTTSAKQGISDKYELAETPANANGEMSEGTTEVTYYYKLKSATVIVHHYIDGTTEKVPSKEDGKVVEDEVKQGHVDDTYTSEASTNKADNYEVVQEKLPNNAQGTMTVSPIEVIYYYKLKDPTIINQLINKTGTDKIQNADQALDYTIQYQASIRDYKGNATLKVKDILPYTIVERATGTNLNGGKYVASDKDEGNKPTISWDIPINNIDTYTAKTVNDATNGITIETANGVSNITISKTIKVTFEGIDIENTDKFTNKVNGNLKLLTPPKDGNKVEGSFDTIVYKAKISSTKSVDKEAAGEGEKVTYTVSIKNDGNLAKQVVLKDTLPAGITYDEHTIMQKNTTPTAEKDDGSVVDATAQRLSKGLTFNIPANSEVKVTFAGIVDDLPDGVYTKDVKNKANVDGGDTNEVTTKVVKAHLISRKTSDPVSGSKVTEGQEITYKITVQNDGTEDATAKIKDTIPQGTTFVEGSIKVNSAATVNTAGDLATGIEVNVPKQTGTTPGEATLEFTVTVNKLLDGTKIKNTAYLVTTPPGGEDLEEKVPGEPEHTYIEPKAKQTIAKEGTNMISSLNEKIDYNIDYTADISDYTGDATVKLVDVLPYALQTKDDGSLADGINLDSGAYLAQDPANENKPTITWTQDVNGITQQDGKKVQISKNISVIYTGIDKDVTAIENNVKGHVEFKTPERTSEDVKGSHTTTTGFITNVPVMKIWNDSDNKLGQRPISIIFKLTGSDGKVYTKEIAKPGTKKTNIAEGEGGSKTQITDKNITTTQSTQDVNGIKAANIWKDVFSNLPKYDNNNSEIKYTLTEEEANKDELKYYTQGKVIEDTTTTPSTLQITNENVYGKVIVHHYIENNDGTLTTQRVPDKDGKEVQDTTIEGKDGDSYKTTEIQAKELSNKYVVDKTKLPQNANGTINKYDDKKPQEVIYYYKLKDAKVIVKYLEKDDDKDDTNNLVLADEAEIDGKVDDNYDTSSKKKDKIEKDGKTYTLVEDSKNTVGTMTVDPITVTYYYLQNTSATVRYVERDSKDHVTIVKDLEPATTKEGLVGDEFVTNSKDFIGYTLVESPEKTTIKMTKEPQTLIYYYEPIYTGLVEKHIDIISGKVLDSKAHDVQVGKDYDIPNKEFEGYDLVVQDAAGNNKLPQGATKNPNKEGTYEVKGTMTDKPVEIIYYYIKKAELEVNYIDKNTGKPLVEKVTDNTKHENDKYTTEEKKFDDYTLVNVEGEKEGTLKVETDEKGNIINNKTVVTYYYAKIAEVEEHHIDIDTGKDIEKATITEGYVGKDYDIKSKEFPGYTLVEKDEKGNSKLPTNAKGKMTEDKIVVNYYYEKKAHVIVHYVNKSTGEEIQEVNPDTGKLQSSQIVMDGKEGQDYTTKAKEFEYYNLVEITPNAVGKMKVEITKDKDGKPVVNNTIDVYYYYMPKTFNIGVDKNITGLTVNGERQNMNSKDAKTEVYRKATDSTNVQVEYTITVSNTGDIDGKATIQEDIPQGMSLATNSDGTWENKNGKLIMVIPNLKAGEIKKYKVILNWNKGEGNLGVKDNKVTLISTENVPGFKDNNDKDNTSEARVFIAVATGKVPWALITILAVMVLMETITLVYARQITSKTKKINIRVREAQAKDKKASKSKKNK